MPAMGLWIDIEFCTGCRSCESACRQEHGLEPDEFGIKVTEHLLNRGQTYNFIPIPTDLCDLCADRMEGGARRPACAHSCMAHVMEYGPISELASRLANKPRSALWAPKPRPRDRRPFA